MRICHLGLARFDGHRSSWVRPHQVPADVGREDAQHARAGVLGEPGRSLAGYHRLAIMAPVLVEHRGHLSQLPGCRLNQLGDGRNHELTLLPSPRWLRRRSLTEGGVLSPNIRSCRDWAVGKATLWPD